MRCAVYIRVSTNREEQKSSIDTQKETFLRIIDEKNWDVHKFYVDINSGTSAKRKELQNMIEDAKNKKFDIILSKELSRLARNGKLSYEIKEIAEKNNIHIMTLENAINTLERDKQSMFGIYAWLYETESQNTSERVKWAYLNQAKKGIFKGSIPPYGYTLNKGKLELRQDSSPQVVQRIFKSYLSGTGCDTIAKQLYTEGIPSPASLAGKANASEYWHGSSIKKILTNLHYVGHLQQCKETSKNVTSTMRIVNPKEQWVTVLNTHESIISQEDFDAVQQQMIIRTRNKTAPKAHLFTNYIFCAECNSAMWYKENSKGYMCGARIKHGVSRCPNNIKVREDALQKLILNELSEYTKDINIQSLESRINQKQRNQKSSLENKIKSIHKKIDSLTLKKKRFLNLLADDEITIEDYRESISDIQNHISDLKEQQQQLESTLNQNPSGVNSERLLQQLKELIIPDKLSTELLHRLVNRIEIKADGTPRIFYNFSAASAV